MNYLEQIAERSEEMEERIRIYNRRRKVFDPANLIIHTLPASNYAGVPRTITPYNCKYVYVPIKKA